MVRVEGLPRVWFGVLAAQRLQGFRFIVTPSSRGRPGHRTPAGKRLVDLGRGSLGGGIRRGAMGADVRRSRPLLLKRDRMERGLTIPVSASRGARDPPGPVGKPPQPQYRAETGTVTGKAVAVESPGGWEASGLHPGRRYGADPPPQQPESQDDRKRRPQGHTPPTPMTGESPGREAHAEPDHRAHHQRKRRYPAPLLAHSIINSARAPVGPGPEVPHHQPPC